ncbi:transcription factor IIIB [Thraustotheca clavata]|uniref:B-related factor 1 n=1 Tax=Thraustotheca clavata TaxID=74557 RepID=A0A1V9ZHQ9_9STRA|nr:transcription factor IIIB [Thraustotheca clavata]
MARLVCPTCQCTEIDMHDASGEAVCVSCGTVVESNTIVSSVEFSEAGGGHSVLGQFVSGTASKAHGSVGAGGKHYDNESRLATLANGRRRIKQVAGMLRLGDHYVESADRLFALAVQRNFTHGRRWQTIVAACLYVVCRREKSPHLLIDFSDKLQVSVFQLGAVFLKFCRLLQLSIPLIDPSLYIHRFASQLNLGSQMHAIAITALRLVSALKRDWIETGRRPSGVCGAALLIAARSHNVKCTLSDVASVVNIGEMTLKKRLIEFSVTPTAQLTFDQMGKVEIRLLECDPPCFTRNRELETMEALLIDMKPKGLLKDKELTTLIHSTWRAANEEKSPALLEDEDFGFDDANSTLVQHAQKQAAELLLSSVRSRSKRWLMRQNKNMALFDKLEKELAESIEADERSGPLPPASTRPAEEGSLIKSTTAPRADPDESGLSEIDDDEINALILTETEAAAKRKIWETMHADYLEKKAAKAARLEAQPQSKRKRLKKPKLEDADVPAPDTAQHAIYKIQVKQRAKSKNINYEVLAELFGDQNDM